MLRRNGLVNNESPAVIIANLNCHQFFKVPTDKVEL